ncbi:MAG: arginine--tRNA ligase [Gemmatimonadota bacterium]
MSEPLRGLLTKVATTFDPEPVEFAIERPRDPSHGDLSTNIAMQPAKRLRTKPRDLAERFVAALKPELPAGMVVKDIAGPGFINFAYQLDTIGSALDRIRSEGAKYGRSAVGAGRRINVEFVSANPTGPLHVGHGRGAALGDGIAALLEWTGHAVTREFYVNDAGVQITRLAESLWARIQQAVGREAEIPEGGYHGDYLKDAAAELLQREGPGFADLSPGEGVSRCRAAALLMQRAEQDETLANFGVRFDVTSSEQAIYDRGAVDAAIKRLGDANLTFEEGGALWLRTSSFGDDRDRVLRKSDGSFTYLAPDIAYHLDKFARGFDHVTDVWGADHHGYIPRMQAALTALGLPAGWLDVAVVQLVRVVRGKEEVKMSKRSGDFVTLRDLYEETGVDAARYWFLMRRGDSHLVFDIELAKSQTDENPVYYVQMAHARMCGIARNAAAAGVAAAATADVGVLSPDDLALLKTLAHFPALVERAAAEHEPHRITTYLEELARMVHAWYHKSRVLGEDAAIQNARLHLAQATRQVFANALTLLGISAPDRM